MPFSLYFSRRRLAMWRFPVLLAHHKGVRPKLSLEFKTRFLVRRIATTSWFPILAAIDSGVDFHLLLSAAAGSTIFSSSTLKISTCPFLEAQCSGIHPS
ncbi:hypothetical protein B0O99DRAFT_547741, partial [Bisporella sp. PMI_857]